MDCQTCHRQLEPLEPIYRMQFGPDINNGWRTSVCQRCLEAFVEGLKRPTLREEFCQSEPCEVCRRPVFNLKRWLVTRVICSPKCCGVIDTEQAKKLRTRRRSERACLHCRKKFKSRPFIPINCANVSTHRRCDRRVKSKNGLAID
jgi:hypothetical protein